MALTLFLLVISIFFLGFIADPLLNLWFSNPISENLSGIADLDDFRDDTDEPVTWTQHFLKGFFSLGLVGFLKSCLAVGPWHLWNVRLFGSGRRQNGGRQRVENMNVIFVMIGAFTFFMALWKVVKIISARLLQRVSDRLVDIDGEDDLDDPGEDVGSDQ